MHIYCLVFQPSLQPHVSHLQLLKLRHTQVLHRRKPAGTTFAQVIQVIQVQHFHEIQLEIGILSAW